MNWTSLVLAVPTDVLLPMIIGVLLPMFVYLGTRLSSRRLSGALALRFGLKIAVILATGFAVTIAVSTMQVLRTGLIDRAARFQRSTAVLAYALSETPDVLRDSARVQPKLQLAVITDQEVVWAALVSINDSSSVVASAGSLPLTDRKLVERVTSQIPVDRGFTVLRRRGQLELLMIAAVRSADGSPVGAALLGVQSTSVTASAEQTAWLLLGCAVAVLLAAVIMTRRLVLMSVSIRVNGLIARLRGGELLPSTVSASSLNTELQRLQSEVDAIVDKNVRLQRENDAQYELIVERMPEAVLICRDDLIQFANSAAVRLFGVPSASALYGTAFRERLRSTGAPITGSHERAQLRRHNGTLRHVELSEATLPPDAEPRTEIVVRDVTQAVLAEQALARSESTYRALFDSAPIGITVVDSHLRVRAANPELLNLFSLTERAQIIGRTLRDVIDISTAEVLALQTGVSSGTATTIDVMFSTAGDSVRRALVTTQRLADDDGVEQHVLLWLDMTAQRALEAQIQHAQKLEAVGQLSSGIAHDFNNLLTIIRGNAELLEATPSAAAEVAEIKDATHRGEALTRKLMVFSRKQEVTSRPYPVSALIGEWTTVLRRLLPAPIELVTPIAPPNASVLVDRVAFEQIVINLATNARDAMPAGGVLDIRAHLEGTPAVVRFVVTDSGSGMSDAVRARAFEPFFTTKSAEKGTGLGLAIVYGLVTQMGGTVVLSAADGRGTTVTVVIPACEPATVAASIATPVHELADSGRLLLVEDNDAVRKSSARVITSLGYHVVTAINGVDAMAQLDVGPLPDIIVSDVMMPEMSGPQLIAAIRGRGWTVPVVLLSGYSTDDLRAIVGSDSRVDLLSKPWSKVELSELLQRRLERERL